MRRDSIALEGTVRATREALEARLRSGALDEATSQDLRLALQGMSALWDEVQSQARLISRDRRRYARFFEHVPDAYMITTPGGKICEANRAAIALFGLAHPRLLGRPLAGFLALADQADLQLRLADLAAQREDLHSWTAQLKPAAGEPFRASLTLRVVRHTAGDIAELCWLVRRTA